MRRDKNHKGRFALISLSVMSAFLLLLSACSTTSAIPDGEQLYIGMKPTLYKNYQSNKHFAATQEELDLVLATTPNAALLGSPSHRSPFPIGFGYGMPLHQIQRSSAVGSCVPLGLLLS